MTPNTEAAYELAVKCRYTVADLRAYLATNQRMRDIARDELSVAADILEAACSDLDKGKKTRQ
jgi:Flp pilus assembly protein TadD